MSPVPDTQRSFGSRFVMTGAVVATPLYDEHQAHDAEHGVDIGLWLPKPPLFAPPAARERLARAVGEIRAVIHPRLRRLFAVGDAPGPWLSLQPARPFAAEVRVTPEQLGGWIDAVAGALLALHWAGLVHGGVLEADVVTVDGELRVGGGGVWACAEAGALARAVGPAPIAPERRAGGPATAAADAWSLAALIARWAGGPGPDPLLVVSRRHPALAAELGPMLTDDPVKRRHDLIDFVASARAALTVPFADGPHAEAAKPRGRRRKKNTTEEKTEVGHASGVHHDDAEPTLHSGPPVPQPVAEVKSAPIVAVSMKPGGPGNRPIEQPTPPAPTPQLQRPILREPTRSDAGASLGRLAPPRAVVEASRRQARRAWVGVLIAVLVVAAGVMAVLVLR